MTAKVKAIWNLYKHGRLTKEQIMAKVPTVITVAEYAELFAEEWPGCKSDGGEQ